MINIISIWSVSFTIGIAGARGGLGKELVRQSLDKKWNVIGLTKDDKNSPVLHPYRTGWLSDKLLEPIQEPIDFKYFNENCQYDALVISLSATPFEKDYSCDATKTILSNISNRCKKIVLLSADGVGDSLNGNNIGIQVMEKLYLREVYKNKNLQEEIVNTYKDKMQISILRPKVLSYGKIPFNTIATPREVIANQIIDFIAE